MTTLAGDPMMMLLNGTYWHQPVTEQPVLNTTEIWSLINPTDDSHPIHLHLVRFQILDRRRYEPSVYQAKRELKSSANRFRPRPTKLAGKIRYAPTRT